MMPKLTIRSEEGQIIDQVAKYDDETGETLVWKPVDFGYHENVLVPATRTT